MTVGTRNAEDVVVAEVGDHVITHEEVETYLADGLYPYLYPVRSEAYEHALHDLMTEELKRIDLFATGHADDSAFVRRVARIVTEELGLSYAKQNFEGRYLNEETIRAEHEKMGRVVTYRQIVLAKPPGASEAELDSLRSTIARIQQQVEAGKGFDEVAAGYLGLMSDETAARTFDVTWDQTLRDPRAAITFNLSPGEIRSFEGPLTFSVVQIEGIEQIAVPPLDEVRADIVDALHRRYALRATEAFRAEWMGLVDTTSLQWHASGLELLEAWSNTAGFYEGSYREVISRHLAEHGDASILSDGRGEVRLGDLPRMFDTVLLPTSSARMDQAFIKEYLLEAVRTERLADRAR
ncbi:MAG TPA: peptidyl-prolyl cis-trans isomerase, partial [Rhodothermales bacterium]